MDEFDVIVIGAGPAGEVCAGELAAAGLEVAIAEAELVGGECAFYSCMPSKALLRPEQLRREVERVPGIETGEGTELDPEAVIKRRDEVIHDLDDSSQLPWLERRGIELVRGSARLDGPLRVTVESEGVDASAESPAQRSLRARRAVVIATGSAAAMPPIDGLGDVGAWNNRHGTTAREVPESLIVLGGGPVGCELAQAWASLGSRTTLVEAGARLLPGEEPFASEQVAESLAESGVAVITAATVEAVRRDGTGSHGSLREPVVATLSDRRTIQADELLVATGRRPRVDGLALDTVGLKDEGPIEVDGRMRAVGNGDLREIEGGPEARPWLYAIGDVNGRALLTHMGKYQAHIAAEDILSSANGGGPTAIAAMIGSPRVTFTDPQVAAVGLTESEARARGIEIAISDARTSGTPGAGFQGRGTAGTSRLIADTRRGVLVGATFVGFGTAELLHAATIAIVGEVPLDRLRHAVPAFPTRSEIWLRLLSKLQVW